MDNEVYKYAPIIMMDKKEPFGIKKIGFAEYTENGCKSTSFNRVFDLENYPGAVKVLEYVYYLDYDIQHLYDLEHIWVYLDDKGVIVGAEGSFHGRLLNAYRPWKRETDGAADFTCAEICDGTHVVMFSQPGKHAMVASKGLMYIYSELFAACDRLAGIHGLDAPDRYLEDIHISEEDNQRIASFIKDNYSFEPSMEFTKCEIPEQAYVELDELHGMIPQFLKAELDRLGIVYG
ncbi:hypothetical protein [Butyrivibrio sp. VCB2006]|uniref:hypothetical protein n=1 Tax=Butyrivibrio sp. VCB2006 TaxID=1280679 RepID=UPI0003FA34C1|nr:hypothetical protein [Butyrivibrio sp. VCB2006]